MIGPAEKCAECGDWHTYTEAGVHAMIHALITISEMAERSDAHPDVQFREVAQAALFAKDMATPNQVEDA